MRQPFGGFGLVACILSATTGIGLSMPCAGLAAEPARPKDKLTVRLDTRGPYLILATEAASPAYVDAISKAKALHPRAAHATFAPENAAAAEKLLRELHPRYVLLFILPQELDVNFAWSWLSLNTQVDADPFVDVR